MIYEGNDFKGLPRQAEIGDVSFTEKLKGSPLSASLKSLSRNLFESYNTTKDVPAYGKNLSWMPVKIEDVSDEGAKYYSFKPRRMLSLNVQQSIFEKSKIWQENVTLLDKFISLSKEHDFIPVIAYAPSKPHVVMPFFDVKAEDLRSYLSYKDKDLPDADMVKSSFYKNLDAQESTVEEYCRDRGISFISTTNKLQYMTEAGTQMYYTYDQHWTPMGNEVVAEIIYQHLSKMNVLSTTYSLTPKP